MSPKTQIDERIEANMREIAELKRDLSDIGDTLHAIIKELSTVSTISDRLQSSRANCPKCGRAIVKTTGKCHVCS